MQHAAHRHGGQIKPHSESDVRQQAAQAGTARVCRSCGGNPQPEGRLHEAPGHHQGAHPHQQRRQQAGLQQPRARRWKHEQERIGNAHQVVKAPADGALGLPGRRLRDARVAEPALGHVRKPAAHQAVIRQRHPQQAPGQKGPRVHDQRRASPGQHSRPPQGAHRGGAGQVQATSLRTTGATTVIVGKATTQAKAHACSHTVTMPSTSPTLNTEITNDMMQDINSDM